MLFYKLQLHYYYMIEKFYYTYCKTCGEIIFDNECDYCFNK